MARRRSDAAVDPSISGTGWTPGSQGSQCCCGGWGEYMFDAMDTTGRRFMNRLFLVQTIVIVGLVVGLQRLLH